jgi:hypothetical protein
VLAPLRPFFDGRWRDAAFDDHTADVSLKATAVMAAWSGLERGNAPSDVADLARQLALDPEIADPARLLEAAAHLRGGDTRAARAITRETLDRLRISGATSYEAFVWLPVAEWLMGAILSADGEIEAAAPHLQRSVDLAPEAWPGRRAAAALSSP